MDTDESVNKHHARYGVCTDIRGDNGLFGASGARAGAPTALLGAYQGASQPVFSHPHGAPSGLNGQTNVVGSNYDPGIPNVTGMPIRVPAVQALPVRAHYDVHKADYVHVATQPLHALSSWTLYP